MNLIIRKSTESDRGGIRELVASSFGIRRDATECFLDGVYILAVDTDCNKIVGMTGLNENKQYVSRWESNYTCVHPVYRRMGIGSLLVEALIREANSKNVTRLYWSAWVDGNDVSKVEPLLRKYGFEKVLNQRVCYMLGHNCDLNETDCVNYIGKNCKCKEDLWVLYMNIEDT